MITQGFPKQCQPIRSSRMASSETLKKFDFRKKNSKFVEPMFQRRRRHDAAHIEVRFRVNTNVQLEVMERSVLPWITSIAVGSPWVWQQDSAPCHVSNRFMAWLQGHCCDLVTKEQWPPSSPDLNPMDNFIWSYLEAHTNTRPHTPLGQV